MHTQAQSRRFFNIGEFSGLGPLRSEGIVPVGCTYWGAPHRGFVAPDLSYNIFGSQLLTPISSKVMLDGSFFSKIAINFQISFIYRDIQKLHSYYPQILKLLAFFHTFDFWIDQHWEKCRCEKVRGKSLFAMLNNFSCIIGRDVSQRRTTSHLQHFMIL